MTPVEAVLLFVGIPLAVAAIVSLLVLAPGWTRDGRAGSVDAWTGEPLEIGSRDTTTALPSAPEATDEADGSGGTSARW